MNRFKILSISLSIITAMAVFSGCGEKKVNESILNKDDPVTITIWHYYNGVQQTNFDEMVNEFNDSVGREKGIIVEAYTKDSISELADSVVAAVKKDAGAETPPDIFATYAETAFQLDNMDALADIKKYFTDEEISEYVDDYIKEGQFANDNTIKIFPTAKSTEVMILNLTDWQKFADSEGVTYDNLKTWEGLADTAEKYYNYTDALTPDIENDGKAFFGRDSIANYMIIGAKQLGCEFFSKDENGELKLTVDETAVRRLWDNYYVPYVSGYYTAQSRYRSDDAKTGAIIALICSTTGTAYYPEEVTINDDYTYPIENVVLPVPDFEGSEPCIVQQGAGMSVIKSDEKNEYASSVFLKWFTEEERNIEFSINSGYLPVKKSANDFEKISKVNEEKGNVIGDIMINTIKTAIDDINSSELYTSVPFETSSQARDSFDSSIQKTAEKDYAEICERIANGENRSDVISEYISDAAFDEWFADFKSNLEQITYQK